MGLETPLALLGLLAAGLPLLVHRIRRRDLVPIPLPTFALLHQAEARKRRSRGLTDLLLLILRVAIMTLACLGAAAPYVTARLSFGDGSLASVAIVVDDSMSMMRAEGSGTLLSAAVEKAREAIDSLPEGSEVALVAASRRPRVLLRRTDTLSLAQVELDGIDDESMRGTDLKGAVELALGQLSAAQHQNRRMLIISDLAAHGGLDPGDLALEGVEVTVERVGSPQPPVNVHFVSASALPDPTTPGQTSLAFELAADGETPAPVPVRVRSGDREVARAEVTLVDGRGRTTVHVPTPGREQDPTALLEIESQDALAEDNVMGVLLRRADALQVMFVNGDPHPASDADELYYAQAALRLAPASTGALSLRTVDASVLGKYDLSGTDVVVLANAPAPRPGVAARLKDFVRDGGGLVVSAGDRVDPRAYNAALGSVLPCRLLSRGGGAGLDIDSGSGGPLMPGGPSGLSKVTVARRLMLECEHGAELAFEDGAPAVAVGEAGRGQAAILATSLDDDWSDLPLRPGYLPLLVNLLRHTSRTLDLESGPVQPGATVRIPVPPGAARLEVVTPAGLRRRYDDLDDESRVEFSDTHAAGPYRVMVSSAGGALIDAPRGAFVVDAPQDESDLTPDPEARDLVSGERASGGGATVHRSLASLIFLLFGLVVIGEGLVRLRRG